MAQERNEEREYQRNIEVGEANARLKPRILAWCSHLSVELVNFGLLAEMTGLPIGRMEIRCPHADRSISAHDLKSVAAYFVINNCRDCPHHEELSSENAGREILREADKVLEEDAAARKAAASTTLTPNDLLLLGELHSADVTEQSILRLIALLRDEQHLGEAAESLRQSAELAPEFFSDRACSAIAEYFPNLVVGSKCAETLRIIGRKRGQLPTEAVVSAQQCIEGSFCHDAVLGLFSDAIEAGLDIPPMAVVAKIIGHQSHGRGFPFHREHAENPGQESVLAAIGRRNIARLEEALERLFENPERHIRAGASMTLRQLLPQFPSLGPALTEAIIASLSLDDDKYGISADAKATDILAEIFIRYPQQTQLKLSAALPKSTDEVKGLLFRVYRSAVYILHQNEVSDNLSKWSDCVPFLFDVLIPAVTSTMIPLEVRGEISRTIQSLVDEFRKAAEERADGILGALALVTREETEFFEANKGGDPQLPGFPRIERPQYNTVCHCLVEALKDLAEYAPAPTWAALSGVLQSLPSSDEANASLKARLLDLFIPLSKNHLIGPKIIPALFKALMEMEVPAVRGKALEVIGELLQRNPELVPDNMREIVLIYLKDNFIYVHQNAARAVEHMPVSPTNVESVANILFAHFQTYAAKGTEWRYCGEVLDSLAGICRGDSSLQAIYVLIPALAQCRKTEAHYDAEHALNHIRRLVRADSKFSNVYVREVMEFLTRFPEACHDFDRFSQEHDFFLSLFDLPTDAIIKNVEGFRKAIPAIAKFSLQASFGFLSVLLHAEQFQIAAEIARRLPGSQNERASTKFIEQQCEIFAAIAEAEATLKSGDPAAARETLRGVETTMKSYDQVTHSDDTESLEEAFSLADSVAGRLT